MYNILKLGVFTFVTAMAVSLLSDTANGMAFFEEGSGQKTFPSSRKINPSTVPKPKPKPKPKPRPVVKKTAPKKVASPAPKPKPVVKKESDEAKMRRIVQEEIKKETQKKEKKEKDDAKKWKWEDANATAVGSAVGGAVVGATPIFGGIGAIPGAGAGLVGGYIGYGATWSYKNAGEVVEEYKKASVLEDPMGNWHP